MTFNAKNMNINIEENTIASIGNNLQTEVGETIEVSANNLKESIAENADIKIEQKWTQSTGEANLFTELGDMVIKSAGKALVQGATDARISKG
jgi:hypothetical protein